MEVQRGAYIGRAQPGPFQCLSCKTYVTGTESGHCPRCGFVPPSATPASEALRPIRGLTIGLAVLMVLVVIWVVVR